MSKLGILFVVCVSMSSCVGLDGNDITNNYYENNITFEQACILKNHYEEQGEDIPLSVQSVLDDNDAVCN
tara:strand:- start:93 stop:302 length:210 start_codon:yes stop_codon:yes gene_type:complete